MENWLRNAGGKTVSNSRRLPREIHQNWLEAHQTYNQYSTK